LRVLIVKLSSLGDVIQTLPVIEDMKACLPGVTIDWVVEEAFADLLNQANGLARVIPCAERRWRKSPLRRETRREWAQFWQTLRELPYDAVIDFQGLIKSARIARGARLTPRGFSVTYANKSDLCAYEWPVKWLLQKTVPMEKKIHAVARYRALAARALNYESTGVLQQMPSYPVVAAPHERRTGVMFAHGTTRLDNEWPFESWVNLGLRLMRSCCCLRPMTAKLIWCIDWPRSWERMRRFCLACACRMCCHTWPIAVRLFQLTQVWGIWRLH